YAELRRVLHPGGRVPLYDVVTGGGEPLAFPFPWGRDPEVSFVLTADEPRAAVSAAGFAEVSFADRTDTIVQGARFWARNVDPPPGSASAPPAPPAPAPRFDLRDVMGEDFPELAANLRENLASGRARVIQLVARASVG